RLTFAAPLTDGVLRLPHDRGDFRRSVPLLHRVLFQESCESGLDFLEMPQNKFHVIHRAPFRFYFRHSTAGEASMRNQRPKRSSSDLAEEAPIGNPERRTAVSIRSLP